MFTAELTRRQKIFLKCIFYFFKIHGIATLSLAKISKPEQPLFTISKWGNLFNILFIGYVVASNVSVITYLFGSMENAPTWVREFEFDFLNDLVHSGIGSVSVILLLAMYCYRQSASVAIANRIHGIVKHTATLTSRVYEVKTAFWGSLAGIFLTNTTSWILLMLLAHRYIPIFTMYAISFAMCHLVINALMMQYIIVLWVIKELFGALNCSLMDVSCRSSSLCSHVELSRSECIDLQIDYAKKLSELQELYSLLSKLCRDISEFYSAPILVCIVDIFWLLVFFGYLIAKLIVLGNDKLIGFAYANVFIYLTLSVSSLVLLSKAVTNAADEVY